MKALSLFLPYVLPYVYGCSDPMAEQAVLSSCIEFCDSHIDQHISYATTVVGRPDYDVDEPSQSALLKVLSVHYLGAKLRPASLEMVTSAVALRGTAVGTATIGNGTPAEWFNRDPAESTVSVYPPPDTAVTGGITIRAAFSPTRTATSVSGILFNDYAEDIANGAIARLLSMPNQPFSSPKLAGSYNSQFLGAKHRAANLARTGAGVGATRVRGRAFA